LVGIVGFDYKIYLGRGLRLFHIAPAKLALE
jgi:hypothetical protein